MESVDTRRVEHGDALGPGTRIGPYEIVSIRGTGSTGTIYEAISVPNASRVALKVLSSWYSTQQARQRFELEIQACETLRHPNTLDIFHYGETADGVLFYAMELLDGLDLTSLVKQAGPQTWQRAVYLIDQVAMALEAAHEADMIHRDIKPANIFVCESSPVSDRVKLLDFGLVLPLENDVRLTGQGQILGTPRYVAPELLDELAREPTFATDIYGLGLVLYFLVTGKHAMDAANTAEVLKRQREGEHDALPSFIPKAVQDVIEACLRKDPHQRPQRAGDLRMLLAATGALSVWGVADAEGWWREFRASSLRA